MEEIECIVCFSHYDDEQHRPRFMPCGHTMCNKCLERSIKEDSKMCPKCRSLYSASKVEELPVNFSLESLVKLINMSKCTKGDKLPEGSEHQFPGSDVYSESTKEDKLPECAEHHLPVSSRCSTHKAWICERCLGEDHSSESCKIITISEEFQVKKSRQLNQSQSLLNTFEEKCKKAEDCQRQCKKLIEEYDEEIIRYESMITRLQEKIQRKKKSRMEMEERYVIFDQKMDNLKDTRSFYDQAVTSLKSSETIRGLSTCLVEVQSAAEQLELILHKIENEIDLAVEAAARAATEVAGKEAAESAAKEAARAATEVACKEAAKETACFAANQVAIATGLSLLAGTLIGALCNRGECGALASAVGGFKQDIVQMMVEYCRSQGMHTEADTLEELFNPSKVGGHGALAIAAGGAPAPAAGGAPAPAAAGGAPAPAAAGGAQQDNSQKWVEYYRSQGMHAEADKLEAQFKTTKGGGCGAPAPAAGGAQHDYSQKWVEYYRSEGMHAEADKLEAQMKDTEYIVTNVPPKKVNNGYGRRYDSFRMYLNSEGYNVCGYRATIYVSGLNQKHFDSDIENYFEQFGTIVETRIPKLKWSKLHKGFCFITYKEESVVTELLKNPKQTINGVDVIVERARAKKDKYGLYI